MNRIWILLLMLSLSWTVRAQEVGMISGTVDPEIYKEVALYKVVDGTPVQIATYIPDSEHRFAFRFFPEYEGLYLIGLPKTVAFYHVFKFYFKGGEELHVNLKKADYDLFGKNSKENVVLSNWFKRTRSIEGKYIYRDQLSTYVDYFPEVEALSAELPQIKKFKKTGNAVFDAFFPTIVDFDMARLAIGYLYSPRTAHPADEELTTYYTQFDASRFLTDDLLKMPYGNRFMSSLLYQVKPAVKITDIAGLLKAIPSDLVKGQLVLQHLEKTKSYVEYADMYDSFKQYLQTDNQKIQAEALATKKADSKPGSAAVDFSFVASDGKEIALKDLRGKVVLLDFWATWCGPCKYEEPYWEKLNEDYAGKDVAFVGISVDKDKPAWEKYVKEKGLKGTQLHAGHGNTLSRAYKINAIPRYILIDKQGNIIASEAPRPSSESLRKLLDTWLEK